MTKYPIIKRTCGHCGIYGEKKARSRNCLVTPNEVLRCIKCLNCGVEVDILWPPEEYDAYENKKIEIIRYEDQW